MNVLPIGSPRWPGMLVGDGAVVGSTTRDVFHRVLEFPKFCNGVFTFRSVHSRQKCLPVAAARFALPLGYHNHGLYFAGGNKGVVEEIIDAHWQDGFHTSSIACHAVKKIEHRGACRGFVHMRPECRLSLRRGVERRGGHTLLYSAVSQSRGGYRGQRSRPAITC